MTVEKDPEKCTTVIKLTDQHKHLSDVAEFSSDRAQSLRFLQNYGFNKYENLDENGRFIFLEEPPPIYGVKKALLGLTLSNYSLEIGAPYASGSTFPTSDDSSHSREVRADRPVFGLTKGNGALQVYRNLETFIEKRIYPEMRHIVLWLVASSLLILGVGIYLQLSGGNDNGWIVAVCALLPASQIPLTIADQRFHTTALKRWIQNHPRYATEVPVIVEFEYVSPLQRSVGKILSGIQ
eukprot:g4002.t1